MVRPTESNNLGFTTHAALPDGNGGCTPCPEVLTENEAIRYLRLDVDGPQNPRKTLQYYRDKGKLKGTQLGKRLRYTRRALDEFLEEMTRN